MPADVDLKNQSYILKEPFINLFKISHLKFKNFLNNFGSLLFIHDLLYPSFLQNTLMIKSWNSAKFLFIYCLNSNNILYLLITNNVSRHYNGSLIIIFLMVTVALKWVLNSKENASEAQRGCVLSTFTYFISDWAHLKPALSKPSSFNFMNLPLSRQQSWILSHQVPHMHSWILLNERRNTIIYVFLSLVLTLINLPVFS